MTDFPSVLQINLLKANLEYYNSQLPQAVEDSLPPLLLDAEARLKAAGIAIDRANPADASLSAEYAAWIKRQRVQALPMPPSLREEIKRRQVAKATGGTADA